MPLDLTSLTRDSFICLCMTDAEAEGYLFSQIPLLPFSVKPTPSNFHKHLLTKTILIMILSDLHIGVPTCQFPICITLAPPAALDCTVYLPGFDTLSMCWGLWGTSLVLLSTNTHPLADMTRSMTSNAAVASWIPHLPLRCGFCSWFLPMCLHLPVTIST